MLFSKSGLNWVILCIQEICTEYHILKCLLWNISIKCQCSNCMNIYPDIKKLYRLNFFFRLLLYLKLKWSHPNITFGYSINLLNIRLILALVISSIIPLVNTRIPLQATQLITVSLHWTLQRFVVMPIVLRASSVLASTTHIQHKWFARSLLWWSGSLGCKS